MLSQMGYDWILTRFFFANLYIKMINQFYELRSIKLQKDIQPNWPNKLFLLKIYYVAMPDHLFVRPKCEILSLYDRTVLSTQAANQNTGFLRFLNSLFIFWIVCQCLLLVLLDNQPTCIAPKFVLPLYQIERSFYGLWGQQKITFLDSIKCKGAIVLDFCNKQKFFLVAFEFELHGLIKGSVTQVPQINPNCQ